MTGLVRVVIAIALLLGPLLLSCSANREPRIVPELLSQKPVCLALDWGRNSRPTFYGRPAPDTLTLVPNRGEHVSTMEWTDVWGRVELAPSQLDRRGGGWVWWMLGDSLAIQAENPTMDGISIWLTDNDDNSIATWREFGLVVSETSPSGRVRLRPYQCSGPAKVNELRFVGVSKEGNGGPSGAVGEVIRDSSRWQGVWGLIARTRAPYVNFEREMLVLVAGPRGAPGDSVVIERVTESSKELQIRVVAYQQCSPLMVVRQPYHVARVRISDRKPVFENLFVRGSNCIPAAPDRLKITRHAVSGVVPAQAPDTAPAWLDADSSFTGPTRYIPVRFIRNIVGLQFRDSATQAQRQYAIALVSGKVIGGYRTAGIYLVQVEDSGDGSGIMRAIERLESLPFVSGATPDIATSPD